MCHKTVNTTTENFIVRQTQNGPQHPDPKLALLRLDHCYQMANYNRAVCALATVETTLASIHSKTGNNYHQSTVECFVQL